MLCRSLGLSSELRLQTLLSKQLQRFFMQKENSCKKLLKQRNNKVRRLHYNKKNKLKMKF